MECLLMELLPASVAERLTAGRPVEPERYDVTVCLSDIVGFTHISAAATPTDVVHMLNLMYILFDDISANFDVYKVKLLGLKNSSWVGKRLETP